MNDGELYTGVDNPGMFENEGKNKEVEQLIEEKDRKLKELTPKLMNIIDILDEEIKSVDNIDQYLTATSVPEADIRAELRAAVLYKKKLENLKTTFTLALGEVKNG